MAKETQNKIKRHQFTVENIIIQIKKTKDH